MCYRSLILVTVLLFCLGEVCARPISNTPKRRSADYGGEDDGWPRVEGGRLKKCKTAGCPKLDGPPVTLHEEIKMTHVATLTVTVDSLVVVTEYVDATPTPQSLSITLPASSATQPTSSPSSPQGQQPARPAATTPIPAVPTVSISSTSTTPVVETPQTQPASPAQPTKAADASTTVPTNDAPLPTSPATHSPLPADQSAVPQAAPQADPPPSSGAASAGGKKGLNYNDPSLLAKFPGIGWVANWEQTNDGVPQGVRAYPMLWNAEQQRVNRWQATVDAALARGDNVLFSFNEPQSDMCQHKQACMTVDAAVAAWRQYMLPQKAKGAILLSPSITQGDIGAAYLAEFIAKCPPAECKIDALSLHWYEKSHQIEYFKSYFIDAHNNAAFGNLPIYISEWAPTDGDAAQRAAFIKSAVEWMDEQDFILGYALFSADDFAKLGMIDAIGSAYATA